MYRAIFESNIPGLLSPETQALRITQWQRAGFNTVILQVDSGSGACWPSTIIPIDPRINLANEPLRKTVDAYHAAGFTVVLDFATALFATWINPLIRPEYAEGGAPGMYNYWLPTFQAWKSDVITECAAYVDADGIALDYLRTGRHAQAGEALEIDVINNFISLVRLKLDKSYPLISVNNAVYAQVIQEGVDVKGWLASNAVDYACLFNYANPFPIQHLNDIDPSRLLVLSGNYELVNGQATARHPIPVAKDWRRIAHTTKPLGLGLYLANLLTDSQADHLKWSTFSI